MKVDLALGGDGARGYAHIGALKALHERGVEPIAIAADSSAAAVSRNFSWSASPRPSPG